MSFLNGLAVLVALYMLVKHGRRALLFLAPGLVRAAGDAGRGPGALGQLRAGEELLALGFRRLGVLRERGALGGLDLACDAWANEALGAYADVFARGAGRGPSVAFLSPFADGAAVLTANHPRLSFASDAVQVGGLPGADIPATWAAHRKALERFAALHGRPSAPADIGGRLSASRAWYRGAGRRELRRLFLLSFLSALAALLLLAGTMHILLRLR